MNTVISNPELIDTRDWVRETRFGKWFVSTDIWIHYVLQVAIGDFQQLLGGRASQQPVVLDAGCGIGLSFPLLAQWLQPRQIIGTDIDLPTLQSAAGQQTSLGCDLKLVRASAEPLPLPDHSMDLIRAAGFELSDADLHQSVPWWSRVDFGLLKRWGISSWSPEFTELNAAAFKPLAP